MTPDESKAAMKRSAQARAAQAENQATSQAPQVYRAPQINVPANRHEFAKLIQSELTKIEQAQSALLSLLEEARAGSPGVKTINGEGPDSAGDVALSAADVGAFPQTGGTLNGGLTIDMPSVPTLWLSTAGSGGARLLQEPNGSLRLINDRAGRLLDLAPEGHMAYGGKIKSFEHKGMRQDGGGAAIPGGTQVEGFPITLFGDDSDSAFHTRGVIDGQYHFAQWALQWDGQWMSLEMRTDGKLYLNGVPVASAREAARHVDVSAAILRAEIKEEIYAELAALGVPVPGI